MGVEKWEGKIRNRVEKKRESDYKFIKKYISCLLLIGVVWDKWGCGWGGLLEGLKFRTLGRWTFQFRLFIYIYILAGLGANHKKEQNLLRVAKRGGKSLIEEGMMFNSKKLQEHAPLTEH